MLLTVHTSRALLIFSWSARPRLAMPFVETLSAAAVSTGAKRSLSPSESNAPSKTRKVEVEDAIAADLFEEEASFDNDALIEATLAAEERESKRQSQSSASSNGNGNAVTASKPKPSSAPTVATAATVTTTATFSHSDARVEEQTMDAEWYDRLKGEMQKPSFVQLKAFLQKEAEAGKTIYPPAHLMYSWSRLTPLSAVKVVVVGQDPYHGPNQACGHSFSVPKGVRVPGSLVNIYKELDMEYGSAFTSPKHGCLDGWARQGVMLLNACLTVSAGQAGSHHGKGWEPFTKAVLRAIADEASRGAKTSVKSSTIASMFSKVDGGASEKSGAAGENSSNSGEDKTGPSKGVVFLAWGQPAQKMLAEAGINDKLPNTLILRSPHPSPLSAHRGFLGNGHFKKANEWLEAASRYGKGGGIQWGSL